MMKYLLTILLLNGLFISAAHSRNCVQAVHNKHCSASSGNSGSQSQTTTLTGAVGQTPDPAQVNSHLGTGTQTQQPVVQVHPLINHQIVGTAQAPTKPVMKVPPLAKQPVPPVKFTYNVPVVTPKQQVMKVPPKANVATPPIQVYPVPGKTVTGYGAVPLQPVMKVPPKANVATPPVQVYPVPGQTVTGYGAIPSQPVMKIPPKASTATPPIQVYPVPGKTMTGYGAIPSQPVMNVPQKQTAQAPTALPYNVPKIVPPSQPAVIAPPSAGKPPIQVYQIPTPVITGQGKVPIPPVTNVPSKVSTMTPPIQVYPIPTPILIGQAAIPVKPVMAVPPKSNTAIPLPQGQKTPTPVLITHVASTNLHPDILLQQMSHGSTDLKSLEPHIKDLPMDVYTNKNVRKMTYAESASTNSKGFYLAVLGIKEATFVDTGPLPVAVKSDDIIFNFSFASAEIHKDQFSQIDKIIDKHSKNGKQIILMGETDGFGSETYNKHLAVLRAHKIIDALKARGVKIDDIEIRILVRCCRKDNPNKETLAETRGQRITWVHFQ